MKELATKPYLIRAIVEWCADSGLTPYLAVKVDEQTRVPKAYVKDGQIVINLGPDAVRNLHLGNDNIACSGRFGGVSHGIDVPMTAVISIFAKETGQGLVFQGNNSAPTPPNPAGGDTPPEDSPPVKPRLRVVK